MNAVIQDSCLDFMQDESTTKHTTRARARTRWIELKGFIRRGIFRVNIYASMCAYV